MVTSAVDRIVLVGQPDPRAMRFITRNLRGAGYRVLLAQDMENILDIEMTHELAVVVLDEDLKDCIEIVQKLHETTDVPILFLSLMNESKAAEGLRMGADGVIMKPFSAELLLSNVESITRRYHARRNEEHSVTYNCGALVIDFQAHTVLIDGRRIHLSLKEYRLLQVMALNGGRVLTHDQLLRFVWGAGYEDSGDLLRGYIRNLRRRIGDSARNPDYIHTEIQIGYWMRRSDAA